MLHPEPPRRLRTRVDESGIQILQIDWTILISGQGRRNEEPGFFSGGIDRQDRALQILEPGEVKEVRVLVKAGILPTLPA